MAEPRTSSILLFSRYSLALLEHLEHSVGHHETAEDVRRAEHNGDESQRVKQRSVGGAGDEESAQHHDAVDRVRAGHEGRVQHRGNPADHLEAHEDRHDENVNPENQLLAHLADPAVDGLSGAMPSRLRVGSCRTWPSAVTVTASMMSSLKLRLSSPFGASSVTRAEMFFAYI